MCCVSSTTCSSLPAEDRALPPSCSASTCTASSSSSLIPDRRPLWLWSSWCLSACCMHSSPGFSRWSGHEKIRDRGSRSAGARYVGAWGGRPSLRLPALLVVRNLPEKQSRALRQLGSSGPAQSDLRGVLQRADRAGLLGSAEEQRDRVLLDGAGDAPDRPGDHVSNHPLAGPGTIARRHSQLGAVTPFPTADRCRDSVLRDRPNAADLRPTNRADRHLLAVQPAICDLDAEGVPDRNTA